MVDNVEEPQEDVEVPRSTSEVDESSVAKMVKRKRSNDSEDEGDANLEAKKPKSESGPSSGHNELCPIISQTEDSLVVEIPHDRVGQIIGTKGMIIQDIQARSGCQAKVNQDFPPGVPRQMEFRGTKATIAAGLDLVKRILEFGPQSIHANTVFGGPQITTTMDCPMSIVGKVIGTGGQTIKEIQSKSGAKVQIYQDFPPDQPRKLEITGSANAVGVAVNLIQTIMTGGNINGQGGNANTPRSSGQSAGTYSQGHTPRGHNQHQPQQQQQQHMHQQHHQQHQQHYNPPPVAAPPAPVPSYQAPPDARQAEASIVIEVQKMLVGKIIGKGGENIVNLKRKSGCQIVVDQNVPEGYPCRVNISGVPYNIELARKLIEDIQMGVHMSKLGANLPPPIATGSGMSQAGPPMAPQPVYGAYPVQSYGVPPTSMPAQPAYAAYGAYPSAPPAVATYPYGGVPQPSPAPAPYSYPPYQQPHAHAQPQQQQHHHHSHSTTPRGSASHKPAPAAPQPNANVWTEYKDDEGRSYWYNSTTGTSQWEPPSYKK